MAIIRTKDLKDSRRIAKFFRELGLLPIVRKRFGLYQVVVLF